MHSEQMLRPTLAELLQANPLSVSRALALGSRLFAELEALHCQGIVHGHLSLASVSVDHDDNMSLGEVSSSAGGDVAGDIYAAGVLLYELLTGAAPFPDAGFEMPIPPRALNVQIPSPLERVVLALLDTPGTTRFASAQAVLTALESLEPLAEDVALPNEISARAQTERPQSSQRHTKGAFAHLVTAMLAVNRGQYAEAVPLYRAALEEFRQLNKTSEILHVALLLGESVYRACVEGLAPSLIDPELLSFTRVALAEGGRIAQAEDQREAFRECERLANALEALQTQL